MFSCFMWGWYNIPFRLYFWIFGVGLVWFNCAGFGGFWIFWACGLCGDLRCVCVVFGIVEFLRFGVGVGGV